MIDMDDLVGDDDFFQAMTVYRRAVSYNGSGAPVWTPVLIAPSPLASIQSGANPETVRDQNLATTANMITVYTDFRLMSEGDTFGLTQNPEATATTDAFGNQILPYGVMTYKPDIIMYHGDPFEVFLVQDWTDYGAGFIQALARKISSAQSGLP